MRPDLLNPKFEFWFYVAAVLCFIGAALQGSAVATRLRRLPAAGVLIPVGLAIALLPWLVIAYKAGYHRGPLVGS